MADIHGGDGALGSVAAVLFALIAGFATSSHAAAQRKDGDELAIDPYTENDPEAMKAAGYVRFGPFHFADEHTTDGVEETLGGVPLLWVETEHFKIGSSLDELAVPTERLDKKLLLADLKRLKAKLPSVKSKPKVLDPWLRLHLYAMRLEELYASFLDAFGLEDATPVRVAYEASATKAAETARAPGVMDPNLPIGAGPYLGMQGKLAVLLVQKGSSLSRYTAAFCGEAFETSYRNYFQKSDSFFFGLSFESLEGSYARDAAFHYGVVFGMIQNFADGYQGFTHNGSLWWTLGLARWFARGMDDRFLLYTSPPGAAIRRSDDDREWEPKVRGRVEHDFFPSTDEMLEWRTYEELKFAEHMILWSRVDFVMSLDDGKPAAFLNAVQAPVPWDTGGKPRADAIREQLVGAFQAGLGMSTAEFDVAWAEYVLKNYSKR